MSRFFRLGVAVAALALAVGAQSQVREHPEASVAGFAVAMVLFALLRVGTPGPPVTEGPPAAPPARLHWWALLIGCGFCAAAGVAVSVHFSPTVTHGLWFVGLGCLGSSAVLPCGGQPLRVRWRVGQAPAAAALLLVVLATGFFGWHLTSVPPIVHGDEAETGLDAVRLLEAPRLNLFRTGWFELPMFHAVPTAIGLKIFGINLTGLRATSAVLGGAAVLLLFAVVRRLWCMEVALLSGLLLVSQRYFVHLARSGYHYVDTPFLSLLSIWLFLRLWHELRWGAAVWCGIALGLGVQTYYASRLVPLLLAATWLVWLVGSDRQRLARRVTLFAVVVVTALATCAPMVGHFWNSWGDLWSRTRETSVFAEVARQHLAHGYGTSDLYAILQLQLKAALGLFNVSGDASIQYGYGEPLLEPVSAALFALGVAALLVGIAERRCQLALLWLFLPVVIGGALTIDTPFYPRISGAVPFAALAVAMASSGLLDVVRGAVAGPVRSWAAWVVAAALLVPIGWNNVQSYFFDYAPYHRHNPGGEIGMWVRQHGTGKTTYMVGGAPGYYIKHGSIRFVTHGYETRDIEDLEGFLSRQKLDRETSLFVVMPQGAGLIPLLERAVGPLTVEEHSSPRGLEFYTAVPAGAGG